MFKELHAMVKSIVASVRTFMSTGLLLLLMLYGCGIVFTQFATDPIASQQTNMKKYWGSLGSSMLVLFQAISGGLDWTDIMEPMQNAFGLPMAVGFLVYIAFAMLVMLNLVTGTFVHSAQENMKVIHDMDLINRVREICMSTDSDRSGEITWEEFQSQTHTPHMIQYMKAVDLHYTEARLLFSLLDVENEGRVSSADFVNGCLRLQGPSKAIDLAIMSNNLRSMFRWHLEQGKYVEAQLAEIREKLARLDPIGTTGNTTSASDSDNEMADDLDVASKTSHKSPQAKRPEVLQTMTAENVTAGHHWTVPT
jgi:hypothetical protein